MINLMSVFNTILSMSKTASIVIIVVIIMRILFKRAHRAFVIF